MPLTQVVANPKQAYEANNLSSFSVHTWPTPAMHGELLKRGKNQSLWMTNLEGKGAPLVSTDSHKLEAAMRGAN